MPLFKRTVHATLTGILFISFAAHSGAQSRTRAESVPSREDQQARIHRIEAAAFEVSLNEHEPPQEIDLKKLV